MFSETENVSCGIRMNIWLEKLPIVPKLAEINGVMAPEALTKYPVFSINRFLGEGGWVSCASELEESVNPPLYRTSELRKSPFENM